MISAKPSELAKASKVATKSGVRVKSNVKAGFHFVIKQNSSSPTLS